MQEYTNRVTRRGQVPSRFPVLRTLSGVAQVVGWILLVGGGVVFIIAVLTWLGTIAGGSDSNTLARGGTIFALGAMVPSIVAALVGFFSVLFAETIKVFMGIEQNTFHMVEQRGEYERRLQQQGDGEAA
jgi:hypothetical protein